MFARSGHRTASFFSVVLGLSLLLSSSRPCFAQTDPDELARRHFESGAAYFEQAEYQAALREFEKAYELSQRPQILRNISVVQERLGNIAAAVEALDRYLEAAPNDPDVETIRIRRDNLKKHLEEQRATEAEPAPPPPDPVAPKPRPAAPPPEEDPAFDDAALAEEDEGPNLAPAYVLVTLGGLTAVGAVVTGLMASSEHERLKGECGATPSGCSDADTSQGETLALTSTVLSGVAVVSVGIGAILWASADSGSESASAGPQLQLAVGRHGGFGQARWQF